MKQRINWALRRPAAGEIIQRVFADTLLAQGQHTTVALEAGLDTVIQLIRDHAADRH